jgi:hypothetical protein
MIPVNVLSLPMLVVSVGPRPANSRPANSTREYEPGSGESHDSAPVHRPHPARSPPAGVLLVLGAPQPPGAPLQPPGCCASLTRPAFGRPWTPEPLRPWVQESRAGQRPCPCAHGAPKTNNTPASPGRARGHHQDLRSTHLPQTGRPTGQTAIPDPKTVKKHPAA